MLGMIDRAKEQIEKTINSALDKSEEFLEKMSKEEIGGNLDIKFLSDGLASLNRSISDIQNKISSQLGEAVKDLSVNTDSKISALEKRIENLEKQLSSNTSGTVNPSPKSVSKKDLKIKDYDELGVRKIFAAMEDLDTAELEKIKIYEKNNKNRVTIIRSADRLIEDKKS